MKSSVRTDLNAMWDKINFRSKQDEREGNLWVNNLEELINEIVKLKMKSKKEHDTMMYHQLNSSLT